MSEIVMTEAELAEMDKWTGAEAMNCIDPFRLIGSHLALHRDLRDLRERVRKVTEPWAAIAADSFLDEDPNLDQPMETMVHERDLRALAALHDEVSETKP